MASATAGYPLSAIVGHDRLRLALVLSAVRPDIGGVLIRGEKGTAKSTAVRALASVLGSVDGARLVELPIGATEDRVVGSLDLQKVLRDGEHAFSPGLLARADGGVLYVDEVNLLHDHLVDVVLDAAAMGRVHVERDGVSHSYDARFVLIGTMNPEEGSCVPSCSTVSDSRWTFMPPVMSRCGPKSSGGGLPMRQIPRVSSRGTHRRRPSWRPVLPMLGSYLLELSCPTPNYGA